MCFERQLRDNSVTKISDEKQTIKNSKKDHLKLINLSFPDLKEVTLLTMNHRSWKENNLK